MVWQESTFSNDLDTFDTKYSGFNNLSRFRNFPWTASLDYFYKVNHSSGFLDNVYISSLKVINEKQNSSVLPYIKTERFSGFAFSYRIPFMYSMYLKKTGLMVNILDSDIVVPMLTETSILEYTGEEMITSLGSIQQRLKLMNLIEFYLFLLIIIFGAVGGISLAVSSKFSGFYKREENAPDLKSTIIKNADDTNNDSIGSIIDS